MIQKQRNLPSPSSPKELRSNDEVKSRHIWKKRKKEIEEELLKEEERERDEYKKTEG